jgi:hypothetical protein
LHRPQAPQARVNAFSDTSGGRDGDADNPVAAPNHPHLMQEQSARLVELKFVRDVYGILDLEHRPLVGDVLDGAIKHARTLQGLRSSGIPRLERGSVLFLVGETRVTVMRVGYLGSDVWSGIPTKASGQE